MEIFYTIKRMFPAVTIENVEVVVYPDQTWRITRWDLPDQQPTNAEVEAYWTAHQQEILSARKPPPSDAEILQKQITDLSFELMLKVVL